MNCEMVRNRVLALEDPNMASSELTAHIDGCASCRSWYRNVLLVEKALAGVPVPESDGMRKFAVLEQIRAWTSPGRGKPAEKPVAPPIMDLSVEIPAQAKQSSGNHKPAASKQSSANHKPVAAPPTQKTLPADQRPQPLSLDEDLPKKKFAFGHLAAKFWPAGLVAATLLVGTIAWLSLRDLGPKTANAVPADPMLDNMVALNVELAKTKNLEERANILAKMADEVNKEMREIARADGTGENMQALQVMYQKVVLTGLVSQAKLADKTDKKQRAIFRKIADGLAESGQKATQMAAESPQHSAECLRDAANTAREGTKQILTFIKEA